MTKQDSSSTATINIDLCIKGDADMRDSTSGDLIGINNESFANTSVTNLSVPSNAAERIFTTSNVKAGEGIVPGGGTFYRFWLDVSSLIPSGTYNNTITITGVEENDACS